MALIAPVYFGLLVDGRSRVPAVDYDLNTRQWTMRTSRLQLFGEDIIFDGDTVMTATAGGFVQCSNLTYKLTNESPRIDFFRKVDSVPRRFASLTQTGVLVTNDVFETLSTKVDRLYFPGSAASIGLDGLFTIGLEESDEHGSEDLGLLTDAVISSVEDLGVLTESITEPEEDLGVL